MSDTTHEMSKEDYADELRIMRKHRDDLADALSAEQGRLREQQRRYTHDMKWIDAVVQEQKKAQGWCNDGFDAAVKRVNAGLEGGFEFTLSRTLVKASVDVVGTLRGSVEIWHYEDDDPQDVSNWRDSEGDEIKRTNAEIESALENASIEDHDTE